MIFLALLAIPALVALCFFILGMATGDVHKITLKEFLVHFGVQILIAGISALIIYFDDNTGDQEVWNGKVVKKYRDTVSCSHSYPCNCRQSCSGSGSSRSCSTICSTCYRHLRDYNWILETSNKEEIWIDRVDSQGAIEPPRFTSALIGEPTAVLHSYTNYVKGAPDSLFRKQGLLEKYKGMLPVYPDNVYDYHYLDRALGFSKHWNRDLTEANANLAMTEQVNVVLVNAGNKSKEYAYALEQKWLGGKKNDVVVILGNKPSGQITWVHVLAWVKKDIFKVKLRDSLLALEKVDQNAIFYTINKNINTYYERKPMKDFEYLKASITPTPLQWGISLTIGLIVAIILGIFFWKEDPFGETHYYGRRY